MNRVILVASLLLAVVATAADRPNIIYILADDLGYGDLGCYGQEILNTPAIDRMAEEGLRFTRHYSGSTVCAPSRCVLLTGLHTGNCSVRGNGESMLPIFTNEQKQSKQRTLYWEFGEQGGKQSVLQGDWKLVRLGLEKPVYELYNVVEDPSEEIDLFPEYPEKVSALMKILKSVPDEKSAFRNI